MLLKTAGLSRKVGTSALSKREVLLLVGVRKLGRTLPLQLR